MKNTQTMWFIANLKAIFNLPILNKLFQLFIQIKKIHKTVFKKKLLVKEIDVIHVNYYVKKKQLIQKLYIMLSIIL